MENYYKLKKYLERLDVDLKIEEYESDFKKNSIFLINGERVLVEIKKEIRPQQIPNLDHYIEYDMTFLLVAEYITPKAKEILKNRKVNYLDSFGNGSLSLKYLRVYIEKGNAKPNYRQNYKAFTASDGQVLFYLLGRPEKINATYREIAKMSNVSLGTVSKTFKTLKEKGYVVKWDNYLKYQLVNIKELLNEWILILNEKTLPAHKIGNFHQRNSNTNSWQDIQIRPNTKWGGEVGAAILTDYLIPEKFRMYTDLYTNQIISELKLIPNEDGNIEVYKSFWRKEIILHDVDSNNHNNYGTIHPLIIYAELMYSNNERNIETATQVYNEYIRPTI